MFNFKIVHLTQFSRDFILEKSKLGDAPFKIEKIQKLEQKNFVLFSIKRPYFSETPGKTYISSRFKTHCDFSGFRIHRLNNFEK